MSDELNPTQLQTPAQLPQHPYTPNQEPKFVCEPGDKECAARWVQAFGDCVD